MARKRFDVTLRWAQWRLAKAVILACKKEAEIRRAKLALYALRGAQEDLDEEASVLRADVALAEAKLSKLERRL